MENNIYLFLICGKAKTGKNRFAKLIRNELEKLKYNVCEIQLTRTIKGYAKDYFGWDGKEETKPRDFLQQFSTEIIRKKLNKPDFHIDRLCEDISVLSEVFNAFIVDDVRLPHEIEELRRRYKNVYVVKMERENYDDGLTEEQKKHITEIALDNYNDYDRIVYNNSLEELIKCASMIVKEVMNNEIHD